MEIFQKTYQLHEILISEEESLKTVQKRNLFIIKPDSRTLNYDIYFKTSEETIENVANIWIDFRDTSLYRIPHKIDDYYFHLSSTFINTGIIDYNFQVRDLVENVGKTEKTIVFQFLC